MNNEKLNLEDYGYNLSYNPDNCEGTVARIMAVHRERFEIVSEYGFSSAIIKSSVNYNGGFEEYPTVGDFVIITYNPYGESLIMKTLRRKTFFERKNPTPGGGAQAVAANFDYVFIMQSLNHDINLGRIERYLSLAYESGAVPVILLTKADLCDDAQSIISEIENVAYGVGIYKISCVTGEGLEELSAYVKNGKTIVFLGSSGIGKSTLLNTLAKSDIMKVNSIREDDSKGRHTTTHRQLIRLENGAMIIDTPGMRELGMCNVTSGFSQAFDDVESFLGKCRFSDCTHTTEPGCAIKEAIKNGELSQERFESYNALVSENTIFDTKEQMLERKRKWSKQVSKYSKELKKRPY